MSTRICRWSPRRSRACERSARDNTSWANIRYGGWAYVTASAPTFEVAHINGDNGSCEETDALDLSTFEDPTEPGSSQRLSCWQEVVRDSVVLTSVPLTRNSSIDHPGYEPIADVVLLAESDAQNLSGLYSHEVTDNTIRSYRSQWRSFVTWAAVRRIPALPAKPEHVAAYLAERFEQLGHRPATLRVAAAAIAYVHNNCGLENPCSHPDVKRTLRGATRVAGKAQKQAKGLTSPMHSTQSQPPACRPRLGKNGRRESAQAAAEEAGSVDIAPREAHATTRCSRVSECAALTWSDIDHGARWQRAIADSSARRPTPTATGSLGSGVRVERRP